MVQPTSYSYTVALCEGKPNGTNFDHQKFYYCMIMDVSLIPQGASFIPVNRILAIIQYFAVCVVGALFLRQDSLRSCCNRTLIRRRNPSSAAKQDSQHYDSNMKFYSRSNKVVSECLCAILWT